MVRAVIRASIRRHTPAYRPRGMVAVIVSTETGCTPDEALAEMRAMVADGEAVWRDPRLPHRIRSLAPPAPAARPPQEVPLWT